MRKLTLSRRFVSAAAAAVLLLGVAVRPAVGATNLVPLWTGGGLSAGIDSAGQAARMAVDPFGNVAVVSGPADASLLAVTSYTSDGVLRWRRTVSPSIGTFQGDKAFDHEEFPAAPPLPGLQVIKI